MASLPNISGQGASLSPNINGHHTIGGVSHNSLTTSPFNGSPPQDIQSPSFFSPVMCSQDNSSSEFYGSTNSTPGLKKKDDKSNQSDLNKLKVRSQSTEELKLFASDEKNKKSKLFISPKLLIPSKKRMDIDEPPPISKTLDGRVKSNPYIKKFKLPTDEILLHDYSAALYKQILLHGRLYLFTNHLCFESKIFGIKTTEIIQIKDIIQIRKKNKNLAVAIEISTQSQKFSFASFVSRDKSYKEIIEVWKEVTGVSHEDASSISVDDDDMDDDTSTTYDDSAPVESNLATDSELQPPNGNHNNGNSNGINSSINRVASSTTINSEPKTLHPGNPSDEVVTEHLLKTSNTSNNHNNIDKKQPSSINTINNSGTTISQQQQQQQQQKQTESITTTSISTSTSTTSSSTSTTSIEETKISSNLNNSSTVTTTTIPDTKPTTATTATVPTTTTTTTPTPTPTIATESKEKNHLDEVYGSIENHLSKEPAQSILESQSTEFQEICTENFNVSVVNFYRALYSDTCNFAYNYHVKRGDKNVVVKNWAFRERYGTIRELEYVAPVNSPIGPDKTRIQETQRYHLTKTKLLVETDTIMLDIPYGDHFRIEAKWDITETSPETCRLTIQLCVRFIKKTWFKGKIESGTIKETKASFSQWILLAKQEIQKLIQLKPVSTTAAQLQLPLNKSVDNKKIEGLKDDERTDSPKPHHTRSRSRQHLINSSSQVNNTLSPGGSHLHINVGSSGGVSPTVVTPTSASIANLQSPYSAPFPTIVEEEKKKPLSTSSSDISTINNNNSSTSSMDKKTNLFKFKSPLGSVSFSGPKGQLPIFIILFFILIIYIFMYIKIVSLSSKLDTMENIFKDTINQQLQLNNNNNNRIL
ncbi:hypothetical protein CYY_000802 [Polysphondylium violaceum]|uniref:VASt domain-containing protein n=1 Tax=Polysphondylium violaceum TaxID=133409 RepID=A0A8J4VB81_9MYCE|nr:hypothetical protein CYY_000802 [Polysphondylium violaceum]